ncbi:RNA polymerase II elongation factor ELL isoform X2 [Thalassophryne amazonica]|uniref:RNA polymerase II elongation factor ELL isoform X2 n=1 Tax=Thalassophryne amazonica TaxID=390379 RepID=UPI001470EB0A|nr:RNA polymerase II elongation factor ELL isoform X2 [Thalassophryne amazonica]
MAALKQDHSYGLSCAQINKNNASQSLYYVKLTDTAIRTLETYQNMKTSLSNQPAICFKENQGSIKIPAPTPDSPDAIRIFRFYLSSDSKEKPQSSFDCIRQEGRDHLESKGSIQDKITVCATDDSYQTTRERMSQVEKDSWSRSAIEIKPGPSKCVKVQRKQGLTPGSRSSKHSLCNKRNQVPSPVARHPLRDRIIHLLALKPYKKPELLLWLVRERANPKDRAELTSVLEEVSKWNPKDNSYSLKPELFKHVQRDWPGYLEEEKQLVHRLLSRWQLKSPQSNHSLHKIGGSPSPASPVRNPSVKRPLHSDLSNDRNPKKQKSSVQPVPLQTPSHGVHCTNPTSSSFHESSTPQNKMEFEKNKNPFQWTPNGLLSPQKPSGTSVPSKLESTKPVPSPYRPQIPQTETSICADQELSNVQHKTKHKDEEGEELRPDWIETSPDLKQNQEIFKGHTGEKPMVNLASTTPLPDYVKKYGTITTPEQRQKYEDDFDAEYDEYRAIHDRIAATTQMFVQLSSKLDTLPPGTEAYKRMQDHVLEKYRKYQKRFPGYREEKKKCVYLHHKLAHIKDMIEDYDQAHCSPSNSPLP